MKTSAIHIGILCLGMLAGSCNSNPPIIEVEKDNSSQLKEHLINANKVIAESEETQIEGYIQRHGWKMQTLSGGVKLEILKQGSGKPIEYKDEITLEYDMEALNGQPIYTNAEKQIVVGKNETVSGVETALKELRRGAEARLIIPSQCGYGVAGDGDRVPTRAVLVIKMTVK